MGVCERLVIVILGGREILWFFFCGRKANRAPSVNAE